MRKASGYFGLVFVLCTTYCNFTSTRDFLDGKIVAAGLAGNGANNDFAIARYNTNGSLDTTFNLSGTIRTPIGSSNESAFGIAIQPNGRILAFGSADMGAAAENFALVRYR
jgi:uncharacterized delta-60 repeat protein